MKEIMNFPLTEQETTVTFLRGDQEIEVYSSDMTMITKLKKLTDKVDVLSVNESGSITSAKFTLKVNQLLFRKEPAKRVLTEEQKQRQADILRKANKTRANAEC